ncbi:MAG: hypothetical protein RLY86_1984 [Pseudomonadota bacterium]|jgi:outer membrane lipase/esterase
MMHRVLASTALALVLTAAAAVPAAAQQIPFRSTTVFGDSLSDTGNLVPLGAFPGAPYVNGRFSNGDIWVDHFRTQTGTTVTSRAFGGAQAIRTTPTDLTAQVTAFLAGNPQIDRSQQFALWIGGNDYLALLNGPAPSTAQVSSTIGGVATVVGTQAGRLAAAGARNFLLFNLPPLGQIPATSTQSAQARSDANQLSALHAEAIRGVANSLRATGATVVVVDVRSLFADVVARPAIYGFTNTTVPCFAPTATGGLVATGACAMAQGAAGSVFFDAIHPTTATHRVTAQFANGSIITSLVTPQGLAAATQVAQSMFQLGIDGVAGRMAGARTGTGSTDINAVKAGADGSWGVYAFGTWADIDSDGMTGQLGYQQDAWNAGLGLDYRVDQHLTAGIAVSLGDGEADLDNAAGTIDSKSYGVTAYATMGAAGGFWGDLYLAYAFDDMSIARSTGFAPLPVGNADTSGHTLGMGGTVGYSVDMGGIGLGPLAGLRYSKTDIDGFTEEDAGPLGLVVDKMSAESFKGRLGVQAAGRLGDEALGIVPSLEIAYQREFSNNDRRVSALLPGGDTVGTVASAGGRNSWVVGAGLAVQGSGGLTAAIGYDGTVSGGSVEGHAVSARVKFSF